MSPPRTVARKLRSGRPSSVGMSEARLRNVTRMVHQWVDEGVAQTMEVLAVRRGTIVLHEVCGRLTPDADSPPTPLGALFPIASITKVFTATCLMTLVEEGRVGINRPVVHYIPEFKGDGKEAVLVRHLLTHTSGLREEEVEAYARENRGKIAVPKAEPTIHPLMHEYYSLRYGAPLWKPPGTEMSYANFNFELAGDIVRRVSGTSLDRFAESRIFRPLGMLDTSYCRVDVPPKRIVRRPPDEVDPGVPPDPLFEAIAAARDKERICAGAWGILTNALGLAKFGQMFLNGGAYGPARILSPVTVTEMTRNQIPGVGATFFEEVFPEASWGYGWSIHGAKTGGNGGLYSSRAFEHWGSGGIYVWVDPDLEIVGVYLSAAPIRLKILEGMKHLYNDLFTDAVIASVEQL
ncbi:MAG TPA: serine hydrolase domain-containing protein [Nitrososphaerales archaeon]|nr:serine hydrolase domain-containing protein [Nitrososphaerales archaeon]